MIKNIIKECETSTEYILPDYMGDVKKILTLSAAPVPSGKFAGEGEVEFSGIAAYDILYSDSEGKLTKIATTSDYGFSVPISDVYVDSTADVSLANLSVRLTGPRKLVAKAILSCAVKVLEDEELKISGNALSEDTGERINKNIKVEAQHYSAPLEREYAEQVQRLAGLSPDDVEIISTSGAVRILESTAISGGVLVKGELIITAIIRTEEEPPFAIRKYIPFEETVTVDGAAPQMSAVADGILTSVSAGLAEDGDGCSLTVSAIAEYSATVSENTEITVTLDAYLTERDTECKYEPLSYSELASMKNIDEELECEIKRSELGIETARDILALNLELRSVEKKINANGFEITADMQVSGVACEISENNEPVYLPIKYTLPFSKNVNCGCHIPNDAQLECKISPILYDNSLDADTLYIKAALKIAYRILKCSTVMRVAECNTVGDTEYSSCLSEITVYYPEAGETLFDIAKRHHTTGAKIAADNNLSSEALAASGETNSLAGVKKIIIR